jgi:predicted AlkP superfamily pyrophosphatase or phosphodiesterase
MKATWLLPLAAAAAFGALGFTAVVDAAPGSGNIKHVLLLSIDGMHAVDFYNCAHGIEGVNGGDPYCPNLAALGNHAVNYVGTISSKPSDSFPGLATLVTGG